ncbi:hypothetical protein IFT48_04980 [Pseudomonas fluorescens]|nr:hypothetical protein [Pseudomonas fluorescens]MBD8615245.1 hypothetical protein [Pseudomonas putida]MBD8682102.1 hypothetical protein [Pseudomonas sp. CFBP 13719]
MVYGFPGKLLENWEAEPLGNEEFMIHRHDGSSRRVKLNESINTLSGKAIVSRSEFGTLSIGEHSVIIGRGLKHGFQARTMGKNDTWTLVGKNGKTIGQVSLGNTPGNEKVTLNAGHLLQVGDEIYPIVPKKHDISLLVFKTPYENGYAAYINVIEKGNMANRKDGFKGVFVPPAFEGDPALFYDDFNHQKVVTAKFWIQKGDKRAEFHSRDAETALAELQLEKKLIELESVAIDAGIDPMEYDKYRAVLKEIEPIRQNWDKNSMLITAGAGIFKPHRIQREADNSYSMGN